MTSLLCTSLAAAFIGMGTAPQKLLLLPQRTTYACKLADAVAAGTHYGDLLSGPHGIGKSAIALLAYLLCAARRLPVVYIACSESWVSAAYHPGGGIKYFLERLWVQNADLIVENAALRKVFLSVLRDSPSPFTSDVMDALRKLVGTPTLPGFAVITDEVQHITAVVNALNFSASQAVDEASNYFRYNWYNWTNDNIIFQRMSTASAHSSRETSLPDGESHRLINIEPLDDADRDALQTAVDSPAFVEDSIARKQVVFLGGGILRKMIHGAQLLPKGRKPTQSDIDFMTTEVWVDMRDGCSKWFDELLTDERRAEAAKKAMDVVTGKVTRRDAMGLFDRGLVYRSSKSVFLWPVSPAASAIILQVAASYDHRSRRRLSSIVDGRERGMELERQLLAILGSYSGGNIPAKQMDGSPAAAMHLSCSYTLPFSNLSEVIERDFPILYKPASLTFACDAIRMPAASDRTDEICIIESSTTQPLDPKRIDKVYGGFFGPEGVATQLMAMRSGRSVTVALFMMARWG